MDELGIGVSEQEGTLRAARLAEHEELVGVDAGLLRQPAERRQEVLERDVLQLRRQTGRAEVRERERGIPVRGK